MKRKSFLCLSMTALLALSACFISACTTGGGENPPDPGKNEDAWHNQSLWLKQDPVVPTEAAVLPTEHFSNTDNVAVHDPSVFQDPKNGMYYAFGSHFMVASSYDLVEWEQIVGDGSSETTGQREAQKLYGEGVNWRDVLHESVAHAGTGMPSTWAPDVEWYNGKYYMYVSLTSAFGSNRSVISRVEADNVLGPYSNETVLIKSGESGGPNAIDPELFYDKDGKLWLVYGSHFAGIYIKELYNEGENWGLPKEEGYGKLLWKGGGKVVEGPFVFYNATTGYYYLMTTYGALTDDYNMHIARSKNPDGPYVDGAGTDLATSSDNGNLHGNKVAGNFKFARTNGAGSAAMGHNSVIKDKNGRYFVIYHTRTQTGDSVSAGHHLMVDQLFFNEEGWPVMSPLRYEDEKMGTVTMEGVAGGYEVVLHSEETTKTMVTSENYTFAADGTVTKGTANVGTWTVKQNFYVEITLNETKKVDGADTVVSTVFKGVVAPGWDNYNTTSQKGIFAFTAVSAEGRSLWALGA